MQGVMTRTLDLPWLRWPLYAALGLLVAANLVMVALMGALVVTGSDALDWHIFSVAPERFADGSLYDDAEWWYHFRWSPVSAPLLPIVGWMGETAWRLAHFGALLLLPGWVRIVALLSYPFWFDVSAGNVMAFVLVAAYWALRRNRWATAVLLVMAVLMPRPLMVPLVAWIVWKEPEWRWPFAGLFVLHALAVWATGYGAEWIAVLVTTSGHEIGLGVNLAPSMWIGLWWLLVAVPLAALAFWRGLPATSGVLLQPYWLPYYLLMPLADKHHVLAQLLRLDRR